MLQDTWLLSNVNRKSGGGSIRVGSDDLEWPWKAVNFFQADLLNNAGTVWPITTKVDRIKREEGRISRGHPRPHRKGTVPHRSPILWVPFCLCIHPLSQNYQIWRGNTYGDGFCFWGSVTAPSQRGGAPVLPNFGVLYLWLRLAMLHAWTLDYKHMMLCVWWWIPTKTESQLANWKRPPGRPRNVWLNKVQEDANAPPLCTLWRSEIGRGHGAAQRSTRTTRQWWWYDYVL